METHLYFNIAIERSIGSATTGAYEVRREGGNVGEYEDPTPRWHLLYRILVIRKSLYSFHGKINSVSAVRPIITSGSLVLLARSDM